MRGGGAQDKEGYIVSDMIKNAGNLLEHLKKDVKISPLAESRGHDASEVMVDAVMREQETGGEAMEIIFYTRPDVNPQRAMNCIQKACIDCFGHQPPKGFEIGLFDSKSSGIGLIAGDEHVGKFVTFHVKILPPYSALYGLDVVERVIMKRLKFHLESTR